MRGNCNGMSHGKIDMVVGKKDRSLSPYILCKVSDGFSPLSEPNSASAKQHIQKLGDICSETARKLQQTQERLRVLTCHSKHTQVALLQNLWGALRAKSIRINSANKVFKNVYLSCSCG